MSILLNQGFSLYSINSINRVIRYSVRLLFRVKLFDHSCTSDKLYGITWLSAKQRIIYKIIMIVYKCIYLNSPKYVKGLLTYRIESRTSRSSNSKILCYHKFKLARYGERSLRHSAALLWNGPPRDIRLVTSIERFRSKVNDFIIGNFNIFNLILYYFILFTFINLTILFCVIYILFYRLFIYLCIIIFLKHKLGLYLLNVCINKSSIYLSI